MGRSNSGNQILHKVNPPFKAYDGDKQYIFVSYKHKDADIVYPMIKKFHDMGFNIWFDEGLPYGENFDIVIPNKIEGATLFINFITRTCMECAHDSEDYMVKESDIAQYLEVPILAIYPELEEFKLRGYYLTNYLKKQSLYRHDYGENEDIFIERCVEVFMSKGLEPEGVDDVSIAEEPSFQSYDNLDSSITLDSLPCPAYGGSEPYIFVSYSHKDSDRVFPEIKRFNDLGYNVWYDEGLATGMELSDAIVNAILNSTVFVVFISKTSAASRNVQNEIFLAYENIPIVPIFLEETNIKRSDISSKLRMARRILKYRMGEEGYVKRITHTFETHGLNPAHKIDIFGIDYSFRNPDCPIYALAERIYPYWRSDSTNFSDLSDEKYFFYERTAITALCLVMASGRSFSVNGSDIHLDLSIANNWDTFTEAQFLYIDIMEELGWTDGRYDYGKKTIPLSPLGGSLSADAEERHMQRIIESVRKAGC